MSMTKPSEALPVAFIAASIISGAIQPLISLIDTYFAAHISTQDLACLALGGGLASSVGWVSGQLIGGFPGILGRLRGSGENEQARRLNGEVLALAFLIGLVAMVPVALILGEGVMLLTQSEATGSGARHYLQVRLLGLPFEICAFVVFGILRAGFAAVFTPIAVMLVALVANASLNALFVWGFGWGLSGLALASAISPAIAVCFAIVPISSWKGWALKRGIRAVRYFELNPMTKLSARLGSMALWRGLLLNGVLIGGSLVAEGFSTSDLAAQGLALQLWLLLAFLLDGFAHAGLAFGSRLLGAGAIVKARQFAWRLIAASGVLALGLCALMLVAWHLLPGLFGLDGIAAAAFVSVLLPMCVQTFPASLAFVADGLLKGAGDLKFLAQQMAFASLLVFPAALWLSGDNLTGLWWAMTAWISARALLCLWRLRGDAWIAIAQSQMR
jgi:MATE family multidrug resistance protein